MKLRDSVLRSLGSTSFAAVFAALVPLVLLVMMPTGIIVDNEEVVFYRSTFLVSGEESTPSHAVFPSGVTRSVGEYLFGTSSKLWGVESAIAFWRVATAVLLAAGLALIVSSLKASVLTGSLAFAVFLLIGQDLLGGEWIFRSVEGKSIAYGLVMLAIAFSIRKRDRTADSLMAVAAYFHFLVGGFWMIFVLAFRGLRGSSVRSLLWQAGRFAILVSPMVIFVALEQFGVQGEPGPGASLPREIYALDRNSHHVAPFLNLYTFWHWLDGLATAFAAMVTVWLCRRYSTVEAEQPFLRALILGFAYLFIALLLAWLDRSTHLFAKFFLFRPFSLLFLLSCVAALTWLQKHDFPSSRVMQILATFVMPIFLWTSLSAKIEELTWSQEELLQVRILAEEIRDLSTDQDLVLIHPTLDIGSPYASIPRLIARPTYVSWKIMPLDGTAILEWKRRMEARQIIFDDGCDGSNPVAIDFDFAIGPRESGPESLFLCGNVVWMSDHYWILQRTR